MWTSTCALATGPANSFGGLSQISVPIPLLEFMTTWRNSEINFKVWASGLDLSVHVVAISTRFIVRQSHGVLGTPVHSMCLLLVKV